ncbi:co-chaperone YbbN [Thalassotalea euphylliae]|uniref:Co-chaperone YbbN n=1 Tax=Thalassotalea euphylliae TaxID=1655234 RepID=A0A3E0TU80_9GAMM|nr:tetratricopeptide repeat protein [Thalassotalea euphylliae]REL27994.1 co-chaperone YbbN [Thalassotalea euphylliae]
MNPNAVSLTLENFQQVVLEDSKEKLVLVAFWAEQVPESLELRDKLASRTAPVGEHVIFADVDCQAQQQIAMQFGIQGLPTAVLVKAGQPIDALSGPQPDEAIEQFLAKHLPQPQDELLAQAQAALAAGDNAQAYTAAKQAYELDNTRADIKLALADACVGTGKTQDAQALLETIMMVDQDSYYQAVVAKLELANEASNSPELQALEAKLAENPDDSQLIQQLAAQYSQVNRHEDALALLFKRVQTVRDDADSKKLLLDVMKALPDGDPLVSLYRRKLYTLMY